MIKFTVVARARFERLARKQRVKEVIGLGIGFISPGENDVNTSGEG
jgi:hypothetical protein